MDGLVPVHLRSLTVRATELAPAAAHALTQRNACAAAGTHAGATHQPTSHAEAFGAQHAFCLVFGDDTVCQGGFDGGSMRLTLRRQPHHSSSTLIMTG